MAAGNTRTEELAHGAIAHVDRQIQVAGSSRGTSARDAPTPATVWPLSNARLISFLRHRFKANGVTRFGLCSTRSLVIFDQKITSLNTSLGHCTTTLPARTYAKGGILSDQSHRPKSFRRLDRVSSWIFSAVGLTQPGHFSGRKSYWSWQEDTHTHEINERNPMAE
jgi:hypothetical protein